MKKFLIVLVLAWAGINAYAQKDFKWDIVTESSKAKAQLYADVKNFINGSWQVAGKEIMQEDEAKGFIMAKGNVNVTRGPKIGPWVYNFEFNVKYYVKDNKHRIVVDNVFCTSATMSTTSSHMDVPRPPVSDNYPEEKGKKITGLTKKMYTNLMDKLKANIQETVDSYLKFMSSDTSIDTDW